MDLWLSDKNCLPLAGAVPQCVCMMAHNNLYLFHIGEEEDEEVI